MMNRNSGEGNRAPYASRVDVALYVALGCFNIAVLALLCEFLSVDTVILAVIITILYLAEIACIGMRRAAYIKVSPDKNIHALLEEEGSVVFRNSTSPVVAFDKRGKILWYNDAAIAVSHNDDIIRANHKSGKLAYKGTGLDIGALIYRLGSAAIVLYGILAFIYNLVTSALESEVNSISGIKLTLGESRLATRNTDRDGNGDTVTYSGVPDLVENREPILYALIEAH